MGTYKPGRPIKYTPATGVGTPPPPRPGEYRIRNAAGTITYIGETNNLSRRTSEHIRGGKLSGEHSTNTLEYKVADGRSTSYTRRIHEQTKISQHHPTLNKSIGGEGRPAGR